MSRPGLPSAALARFTRLTRLAMLLVLAWLGGLPVAWAHKASDAYLVVADPAPGQPAGLQARLSLALKDLDAAIDTLDADGDRQLTWGEVRAAQPAVAQWVAAGLQLDCGGQALAAAWRFESLEQRSDGVYLRLAAAVACPAAQALSLRYGLMRDIDPTHRLLLAGVLQGHDVVAVLPPQAPERVLRPATPAGGGAPGPQGGPATLANFFLEGVHHILTGYDHLAFLLSLLLPITLRRAPGGTRPAVGVGMLLLTVTGFTVGHSITLALASLGAVSASPAWVEPAIAFTIAVSAGLNLFPLRGVPGEALALVFGLVHGLAFSGVITEAGVSGPLLVWALAGFNLGVEAGQLVCVAAWCALHLALVRWARYEQVVVRGGSLALLVLALYWMAERIAVA